KETQVVCVFLPGGVVGGSVANPTESFGFRDGLDVPLGAALQILVSRRFPVYNSATARGPGSPQAEGGRAPIYWRIDRCILMKKFNILVTGNDGKKFYQNFHVIEAGPEAAKSYLLENFPNSK